MAITWGSWSSNNRLRCGIELSMSPSTITSSTTQVTITIRVYLQTRYAAWESTSSTNWWMSGDVDDSGNHNYWELPDMGYKLIAIESRTFSTSYTSVQQIDVTGKVHSYFAYPGTSVTAYSYIRIPTRPYSLPAAPTAVTVTRNSDTQHTISWTRNATTAAPYHNLLVERWDNFGGKYIQIAQISGSATSFVDNGTIANRQWRYRVRAKNTSGYSGYNYTPYTKTTPAASSTPTAAKNATGDVVLNWSTNSNIADNIEVWHASDGVWDGAPLATLAGTAKTYPHPAPDTTKVHTYRLRAKVSSPALVSAYSGTSNPVQLLTPPNAPSNLSPNGSVKDANESITRTWKHNSVDTTPQRQYEIQSSNDSGSTWASSGIIASSVSSHTTTPGTWLNGETRLWRVRTWGAHADPGPWSVNGTIVLSSKPTVAINSPDNVTPVNSASVTVVWGYFDAEGTLQAQWKVWLRDAFGTLLESDAGNGTIGQYTFKTAVKDGQIYTIDVQVRDSAGSWSDIESTDFSVDYAEPPEPTAEITWDEESGSVLVEGMVFAAEVGEVEAAYLRVWRSVDGGNTWSLAIDNAPPGTVSTDHIPPLNSTVQYKLEAVSDIPSTRFGPVYEIFTDNSRLQRVWLNYGQDFASKVYMSSNVNIGVASSRDKTLQHYDDRELPVEYSSINRTRTIAVKGILFTKKMSESSFQRSSWWDDIERAVVDGTAPSCLRDLYGHRWFVSTNAPSWDSGAKKVHGVQFSAEEIDYAEATESSL